MKTKLLLLLCLFAQTCFGQITVCVDTLIHNHTYRFCADSVLLVTNACPANNQWTIIATSQIIYDTVSLTVTKDMQGIWQFKCTGNTTKSFGIYLDSLPYKPSCMHDSVFCTTSFNWTLDAENPSATYLWDNGTTFYNRTISTWGTHWCRITTTCGPRTDTIHVSYHNSDAPHLGADQIVCDGTNILLNPNCNNVSSYLWSNGLSTSTITVDTTGNYWVRTINTNGCNGRDTVHITTLEPPTEEICFVEFDTATWKNNVHWSTNLTANIDSISIYKEISLNVWNKIGSKEAAAGHFIDLNSYPQAQSYSYKISVIDSCNNESTKSASHTTITLLSAFDGGTDTYGFTWSAYLGLTPSDYNLYGIDGSGAVTQVGTVPGNQYFYNYLNPNPSFVKYFVGFLSPDCSAKTNVLVKSNWVQSVFTGVQEQINSSLSLTFQNNIIIISGVNNNFEVSIYDILGQHFSTEKSLKTIDISGLPSGVYIVNVLHDGKKITKKIVKF
jgi:hypothetical protein